MVTDRLGTARIILDKSGNLSNVTRHDYLPFGEGLNTASRTSQQGYTNSDNAREKFTGYERDDETGLDYAEAKYYASVQGRFTSPDPYGGSMTVASPQSFNRYSYVNNDPVNSVDPSGLEPNMGADQGWDSFEGFGWGSLANQRSSMGAAIIQRGLARHNYAANNDMYGGNYGDPNPYDDNAFDFFEHPFEGYIDENGMLRYKNGEPYQLPPVNVNVLEGTFSFNSSPADPDIPSGQNNPLFGGLNPLFHPLPWRTPNLPRPWPPPSPTLQPTEPAPPPPGWERRLRFGPQGVEEENVFNPDSGTRSRFARAGLKAIEGMINAAGRFGAIRVPFIIMPNRPRQVIFSPLKNNDDLVYPELID